jgi:SAM-dependent methyltransferase
MNAKLTTSLRESYNRKAQERDARLIQAWKLEERNTFLSLLRQEQKRTLLEIGAGTGQDGQFFQDQGFDVVCTDLSSEMVKLCHQKGLKAYVMNFGDLRFPAASFEAIYALNCLLHLPKAELPAVLQGLNSILKPDGLFYLGVYGGYDSEGVWQNDRYEPKRFFSFYADEHLRQVVEKVFDLHSFRRIALDDEASGLHFQSLILRKK